MQLGLEVIEGFEEELFGILLEELKRLGVSSIVDGPEGGVFQPSVEGSAANSSLLCRVRNCWRHEQTLDCSMLSVGEIGIVYGPLRLVLIHSNGPFFGFCSIDFV